MKNILVLMATYNGEKYLDEQLKSLFLQKNLNVSVLVRDDGSIDNTKKILDRWKENYSLTWYTGEHLDVKFGFFDLMEKAVKKDRYDYFAFCDQDDVWDLDKLSCAVDKLQTVKVDVEAVYYCGQRLVDENLNIMSEHRLNSNRNEYARFLLNDAAGCTMVFNRKLLETVTEYKPKYLLMHDAWIVKVCLAVGGNLLVDSEPHMLYRQHGNNVIGLKNDLKSKIRRAVKYINEQPIIPQMEELQEGYGGKIIEEYNKISQDVILANNNLLKRIQLLNFKKYHYADVGLQFIYGLKILLNRL